MTQVANAMQQVKRAEVRIEAFTAAVARYNAIVAENPALPHIEDGSVTPAQLRQAAERGKALEMRINAQAYLSEAQADYARAVAALSRYTSS